MGKHRTKDDIELAETVGHNCKHYRLEADLGPGAAAVALGVSDETIRRVEKGDNLPRISLVIAMCDKYGVTPNQLLGYEG